MNGLHKIYQQKALVFARESKTVLHFNHEWLEWGLSCACEKKKRSFFGQKGFHFDGRTNISGAVRAKITIFKWVPIGSFYVKVVHMF